MSYRKFRLQNGVGEYFELTDKGYKVFANNPEGLGFSKTLSVLRLGDTNVLPYAMYNLDTITFELLFYDDSLSDKYQKYNDLISFLSVKPIYLLYQKPNSFVWYRRQVESLSLSKSEVKRDGMLHCVYQLQTLTFWEDDEKKSKQVYSGQTSGEAKEYPIEYPFLYGEDSLAGIEINTVGLLDTPIEITINGRTTDPQYVIYDNNNNIYGRGKFIGTFDKVYVNPNENEENIELTYNSVLLDNPLGYQDLSVGIPNEIFITFIKAKTGRSKISFILGSNFDGNVLLEWRNRYVTV